MKHLPWKEIETLYCSGVSAVQLAAEYPPATKTAIEKRASRNEWFTPARLRAKAKALIAKSERLARDMPQELMEKVVIDDPAEALALKIVQGQVDHRNNILEQVDRSMKKLKTGKPLEVQSINDLAKLDEIARRTLNLDAEEAANKFVINMSGFAEAPQIIDV
jgi:transposase-like protein